VEYYARKMFFVIWLVRKISDNEKRQATSGEGPFENKKLKFGKRKQFFQNYICFFG